jgi:type VI secretion system protein ImpF
MRYSERESEGLSVLDRLLIHPPEPGEIRPSGDPMLLSIARDLHVLMNSRRKEEEVIAEFPEVSKSILNFGMPALGRYGHIGTPAEQNRLCRSMEEAIRIFEPRLRRPEVKIIEPDATQRSIVRFRIEASVDDSGVREVFEMRLKPATGEMAVAAGAAG